MVVTNRTFLLFAQVLTAFLTLANSWQEPRLMKFDPDLGEHLNAAYWQQKSLEALKKRLAVFSKMGFSAKSKKPAKNVILFVGDGHGVTSVTATRKFKEAYSKSTFYETELAFDSFPITGLAKTYALDSVVAESAGTATTYLTGVKTRLGFVGMDGTADLTCKNATKGRLESIAARAARAGKVTGLVTTTSITNASPAPLYAHLPAPLRYYEYNSTTMPFYKTHPHCEDVAKQFVRKGQHIKVALGGGRGLFSPSNCVSVGSNKPGLRSDNLHLIEEWKSDRWQLSSKRPTYVTSRDELLKLDPKSVDYLLGLFSEKSMDYVEDKTADSDQPSLTEMMVAAINVLSQHKDGYFLFVEGGLIDMGHHDGIARYALTEAIEFDKAIETALKMTNPDETLIVVTADHSHAFTMSGYISHDSDILGTSIDLADDNRSYTILMYANGPGAGKRAPDGGRRNDTAKETTGKGYMQQATVPTDWELHGGEDVPVYALGPYAELFSGVYEQSWVTWAMSCASGIHYGPIKGQFVKELAELCPGQSQIPEKQPPCSKTAGKVGNACSLINSPIIAMSLAFIVLLLLYVVI